ncbi:recombination protein NinG [Escherichia coli]|uniref:recombination protein NinG n=1 Tax=Escherichia coli TaxID=562 RepID=UPI003365281D
MRIYRRKCKCCNEWFIPKYQNQWWCSPDLWNQDSTRTTKQRTRKSGKGRKGSREETTTRGAETER